MRLQFVYKLKTATLSSTYREGFASVLKEALQKANPACYHRYYSNPSRPKPFTFAVLLEKSSANEKGDLYISSKQIILYISTASRELGISLYNALLETRGEWSQNGFRLRNVFVTPTPRITKPQARFITVEPVLVKAIDEPGRYLLPKDEGFTDALNAAVQEISKHFLGIHDVRVELRNERTRSEDVRLRDTVTHGFLGLFDLCGPPEVLNLIYLVGLGDHRSEGFGMLELVQMTSRKSIPTEEGVHE
jgi:CRISPR-associated endoribonuclease Cas6